MQTVILRLLALSLCSLMLPAGCKKKDEDGPKEAKKPDLIEDEKPVAWPKKPADGAPVAAVFVKMIGSEQRRGVQARLFNFSDRDLLSFDLLITYLDANGKELGTWPQRAKAKVLVRRKGHAVMPMGSQVPPKTATARLLIRHASLSEGISWTRPGFTLR